MSAVATAPEGWCVYRAYSAAGELLYIGHTGNMSTRLRGHKSDKTWWSEVADVVTTPVGGGKSAAVEAERLALLTESPRYNIQIARPRMVVVNFRAPADVKDAAQARAEREGINLTDALRDFLTTWAREDGDR